MSALEPERPRDWDAVPKIADPAPSPVIGPEVRRVSYAEHAHDAACHCCDDKDKAGAIALQACRLEPLQQIQTAFDQVIRYADDRRRGVPWDHAGDSYAGYFKAVRSHTEDLAKILHTASDAADSMIESMFSQLDSLEDAMTAENKDKGPQLTPSGEPHPLQKGGYDPATDPQVPPNISDVEALKEGHTTAKQSEAIAKSDAADTADKPKEPAKSTADVEAEVERKENPPGLNVPPVTPAYVAPPVIEKVEPKSPKKK